MPLKQINIKLDEKELAALDAFSDNRTNAIREALQQLIPSFPIIEMSQGKRTDIIKNK